ncbi:uncharacterized protein LOC117168411 isoform X2 [Belonocnema kinseyi]|uniref:uncharacterized protein LOC117168411 isoform X2 n=1 Tax=Belonocnema kinseyi TaxID=2817044 RepID=UPI00143D5664|nr:uncharacterized protein LOC117168411 isoform X2 [Belonocnema kinseyi]XP_033209934.1 uncharacterized protein LOC117168411 isoform X2 [Belonocnema kinseyi]XP_033209935.1 uncharacterized protein LOC117168411 isoform X2 [Belonocnema kinseyi]XP_033209936.1 uncharacterized protein LOC117168411 isoform X2 [Belonocnema kinseyi]
MIENRKPPYSCRTLICFKMSEKDYTINKHDPLSAKDWREVYNLVSIIENMRVYNQELVDKYVKDINEKIYYLANRKRIELNKSIRKPMKIIVSIDKSRINFEALKTFNPEEENEILFSHNPPKNLDSEPLKQNVEMRNPSFYFNHKDQNSVDVLLSVTEDIINSFNTSNSNCTMESYSLNTSKSTDSVLNKSDSDWDYEKMILHNPLIENCEMAFVSQKQEPIFSQNESCKKRIQGESLENRKENIDYRILKSNPFASETEDAETEETETDCSFDINDSSETCSCEMSLDEDSSETIRNRVRRSARISTVYPFPATKLRRSKRIQSSIIAKERVSAKFFPLQEIKRRRSLSSKETPSNLLERI